MLSTDMILSLRPCVYSHQKITLMGSVEVQTAQCGAGDFQEKHNSLGTVSCMAQKYFLIILLKLCLQGYDCGNSTWAASFEERYAEPKAII